MFDLWEAVRVPGVYLKSGSAYVAMKEATFAKEDELQALIADIPRFSPTRSRANRPCCW
jgi:hypothetical protein